MFRRRPFYQGLNLADPIDWNHSLNWGLVGCWMNIPNSGFRGGSKAKDMVRGVRVPNDGTLTNGPTWNGSRGRFGGFGAWNFDGTDDLILVPNRSVLSGMSEFTLTAWVYWRSDGSSAAPRIASKGVTDPWDIYTGARAVSFYTNGNFLDSGSNFVANNGWSHVACTFSVVGNLKAIYINGVSVGSTTAPAALNSNSDDLRIGNLATRTDRAWDGYLDDIRIYSGRSLAATDVRALFRESTRGYPNMMNWEPARTHFGPFVAAAGNNFNASWARPNVYLPPVVGGF